MNATTTALSPRIAKRLAKKVDRLANLHNRMARLSAEAELIKADLKSQGLGEIQGTMHKAVIYTAEARTLDRKRVEAVLTAEVLATCMKTSTSTKISLYDK